MFHNLRFFSYVTCCQKTISELRVFKTKRNVIALLNVVTPFLILSPEKAGVRQPLLIVILTPLPKGFIKEALCIINADRSVRVPGTIFLGVTSCPPSRTPYTHDVRIFYISSLSMLFDICEQCWYQRCVTSIEIGGDVLALGIRFI